MDRKLISYFSESLDGHDQTSRYRKCHHMHDTLLDMIQQMTIIVYQLMERVFTCSGHYAVYLKQKK
jgi:hypothetical protein